MYSARNAHAGLDDQANVRHMHPRRHGLTYVTRYICAKAQ